jgi:hypothetical protein
VAATELVGAGLVSQAVDRADSPCRPVTANRLCRSIMLIDRGDRLELVEELPAVLAHRAAVDVDQAGPGAVGPVGVASPGRWPGDEGVDGAAVVGPALHLLNGAELEPVEEVGRRSGR